MSIVLNPEEIKARTIRRKGRAMGALNALHDSLAGYAGSLTQGEYEDIISEIQEKLDSMKRVTGYRPIPHDYKSTRVRNKMDEIMGPDETSSIKTKKRSDSTKARPPRAPRERVKKPFELDDAIPIVDF